MADVQLKHGYLRLANVLDEAMTIAPFSGTQAKIVRCLTRLTYGWSQHSVRMARPEIAERCGLTPVGGFLRAFDELLAQGVITEVDRPSGRIPGAYAINKDFEHWGRFSVAAARLDSLFRKRPETADRPTLQGLSRDDDRQTLEGMSSEIRPTLQGHRDRPYRVTHPDPIGSVKSPEVVEISELRPPERQERQERQTATASRAPTHAHAREEAAAAASTASPEGRFAIALVSAANGAASAKWGESPTPWHFGQVEQLAADLIALGVSVDTAREAVVQRVNSIRVRPGHPNYFREAIIAAHQASIQRAHDAARPTLQSRPNGEPSDLERKHEQLLQVYERKRRAAGDAWSIDPTNAAALAEIREVCARRFGTAPTGNTTGLDLSSAQDLEVAFRCADAAGFPSFAEWRDEPARRRA